MPLSGNPFVAIQKLNFYNYGYSAKYLSSILEKLFNEIKWL